MLGRRVDMAIRKNLVEFGCGEVGRNEENNTKLVKERGLEAPKIMRDMFMSLVKLIDNEERTVRKLETIGLIHNGKS